MAHQSGTATVHTTSPQAHVLAVGDFDISTLPSLAGQLDAAADAGCRDFRFDLEGVSFLDASMIGVLVRLDRRLRPSDGSLSIVAASSCVRRLLRLVDLRGLLDPALRTA